MSSRVSVTGHIKDPLPLKSRAMCPSGRLPLSFIHHHHQTELVIRLYVLTLKMALDADRA